MLGEGHRKDQPSIGHQAVVVKGDVDVVGWLRGSIYWVLLIWGRFGVTKTIIPAAQEHFLPLQHAATLIFRWIGAKAVALLNVLMRLPIMVGSLGS